MAQSDLHNVRNSKLNFLIKKKSCLFQKGTNTHGKILKVEKKQNKRKILLGKDEIKSEINM